MILIADSGSTKTHWALTASGAAVQTATTGGINPFFLDEQGIIDLLVREFSLPKNDISAIYFYGAGCIPEKTPSVKKALKMFFQTDSMEVKSDLWAAARSLCQQEEGIACILGTGSNSCYYDGKEIKENVSPLGYILGDEGSGAVLGKKLLADVLKKQLPAAIIQDFQACFSLNPAEISDKVYRQTFPNRFLAQFTPFILKHIDNESIKELVENSFSEFIERNVLQYSRSNRLPIHFTGSIAFYFRHSLEKVLEQFHLQSGRITREPLPDLIDYHYNNEC